MSKLKFMIAQFFKSLPDLLYSVLKHFWAFIMRVLVFLFFFGRFAIITYGLSILIPMTLRTYTQIDPAVCLIIEKILLTIAPLLPTVLYAMLENEDTNAEFSIDFCFITWIATIVFAWVIL